MDHITHDEFAGRLEKIMEPLISRPSFKAKIAFFHGNVSSYNPYGTDRLHGAKAYIRALSKVLALSEASPRNPTCCTRMFFTISLSFAASSIFDLPFQPAIFSTGRPFPADSPGGPFRLLCA